MNEPESERRLRFDALFASYGADIVAYASWRAWSAADAEDAVAEVFLTAWRRLDEVPSGAAARLWLYATARRVMANQRRATRRRMALHERLAAQPRGGEFTVGSDQDDTLVREVLQSLAPSDREVLLLAEWEGLTPSEIASVQGCLTVTARGRLHRARRRFRARFEQLAPSTGGHRSTEASGSRRQLPAAPPQTLS